MAFYFYVDFLLLYPNTLYHQSFRVYWLRITSLINEEKFHKNIPDKKRPPRGGRCQHLNGVVVRTNRQRSWITRKSLNPLSY